MLLFVFYNNFSYSFYFKSKFTFFLSNIFLYDFNPTIILATDNIKKNIKLNKLRKLFLSFIYIGNNSTEDIP